MHNIIYILDHQQLQIRHQSLYAKKNCYLLFKKNCFVVNVTDRMSKLAYLWARHLQQGKEIQNEHYLADLGCFQAPY